MRINPPVLHDGDEVELARQMRSSSPCAAQQVRIIQFYILFPYFRFVGLRSRAELSIGEVRESLFRH